MDLLKANPEPLPLALFLGDCRPEPPTLHPLQQLPLPAEILALFEGMTGWVVKYQECQASQRKRNAIHQQNLRQKVNLPTRTLPQPSGRFSIVDMSASWPAKRPTSHRGKCDQFIELLSDLVAKTQGLEEELKRYQSVIAEFKPTAADSVGDAELVDSFVPRYPYQTASERESEFELDNNFELTEDIPCAGEAESNKPNEITVSDRNAGTVEHPQSAQQWQIGGRRGFAGNRYVDWALKADRKMELIVGQIESIEGLDDPCQGDEWEAKLTVNPQTNRFWMSGQTQGAFWCLDHRTRRMTRILPTTRVNELSSPQSIVITTAPVRLEGRALLDGPANLFENADDLASAIAEWLEIDEPILILMRH